MGDSPYRVGDPSARLGSAVSTHRPRKGQYVRALIMAPALLVIGLFIGTRAFEAAERDEWGSALIVSAVAAVALVIAALVASHLVRLRHHQLEIRQFGIRLRQDKDSAMTLWEDVEGLEWAASGRAGRHHVLVAKDGRRVVLRDHFAEAAEIARTVEHEIVSRLLPPLRERLDRGEEVSFGPFAVSKKGLSHGKQHAAWSVVQRAVIVDGFLAIGAAGADVVSLAKRGGVLAWAKAPYGEVPNAALLLAVVSEYRGKPDA